MSDAELPIEDGPKWSPSALSEVPPSSDTVTYDPDFLELVQGMFASMPPERQMLVRRLGAQNFKYIKSSRDKSLAKVIDKLCNNAAAALFGGSEKRRAVFVIGESDSGKTRALHNLVASRHEFRPKKTSKGWSKPFVFFAAPKPLSIKGFAKNALAACDYKVENSKLTEQELFELLKEQIRKKRVIFMWVDEMQHVFKGDSIPGVQNVSDVIKSLLQIPGWPLHLILSGVPTLAHFLLPRDGDRQLRNRSYLVHLGEITNIHSEMMLKLQKRIMDEAGLGMDGTNTPEFMERLTYSCFGAFGTMIKRMQAAASEAIFERESSIAVLDDATRSQAPTMVGLTHYAAAYELETGAIAQQNIFIHEGWRSISPVAPLCQILDGVPQVKQRRRPKKQGAE